MVDPVEASCPTPSCAGDIECSSRLLRLRSQASHQGSKPIKLEKSIDLLRIPSETLEERLRARYDGLFKRALAKRKINSMSDKALTCLRNGFSSKMYAIEAKIKYSPKPGNKKPCNWKSEILNTSWMMTTEIPFFMSFARRGGEFCGDDVATSMVLTDCA